MVSYLKIDKAMRNFKNLVNYLVEARGTKYIEFSRPANQIHGINKTRKPENMVSMQVTDKNMVDFMM